MFSCSFAKNSVKALTGSISIHEIADKFAGILWILSEILEYLRGEIAQDASPLGGAFDGIEDVAEIVGGVCAGCQEDQDWQV
jgi:hypothetical protein